MLVSGEIDKQSLRTDTEYRVGLNVVRRFAGKNTTTILYVTFVSIVTVWAEFIAGDPLNTYACIHIYSF